MKLIKAFFVFFFPLSGLCQEDTSAIKMAVQNLFTGIHKGDSSLVRSAFHSEASLSTIVTDKSGKIVLHREDPGEFISATGTPHKEIWNEVIWNYEIRIDGLMATVWAPYTFFLDNKLSHCGVNSFLLMKTEEGWKIISLTDTRRRSNCREE